MKINIPFKVAFSFILLYALSNDVFAQRVQQDSTTTTENTYYAIDSDSLLVDEILYGNEKEVLVITRGEGGVYINKPKVKEKKFVSGAEGEAK